MLNSMHINHHLFSKSIFASVRATHSTCCNFLLKRSNSHYVTRIIAGFRSYHNMKKFSEWRFTTPGLLANFPVDPIEENYTRRVPNAIFSRVKPTPLTTRLRLVSFSEDACAEILDLEPGTSSDPEFVNLVGGELAAGSQPLAHRYGGHQFGYWADQLGDGRAILLGEYINK